MLWFVGLGVSDGGMSADAEQAIRTADTVYLETFTSPDINTARIRGLAQNLQQAPRWMVEDGHRILEEAAEKTVVLASYGDPMVATTHTELRVRAVQSGIPVRVAHGPSAITSMIGECGLHHYMVGRMATIMEEDHLLETPYMVSYRNAVLGYHTLLLLEYNQDANFFLDAGSALKRLQGAEGGQRRGVFAPDRYCMVACRVGSGGQEIISGRMSSLAGCDFGEPPHSIILTGRLHFTEADAIRALTRCVDAPPPDYTIKSIPQQMIEKYVPMIRESIAETPSGSGGRRAIIQNAISYVGDAQDALRRGQDEVAVLSIGYADGLIDALRMLDGAGPKM